MKLFVDDIRQPPDNTWTLVRTINEAIVFIDRYGEEIEAISLDHDISHQVVVGEVSRPYPCNETFKAVAMFISAYYYNFNTPTIIIHSANPVGAEVMARILEVFEPEITPYEPCNRLEGGA